MKNSTPIILDRLAGALQKHGIRIKRTHLLQAVASAFGYRNSHELSAADAAGELAPPEARYMGRERIARIGWMHFFQDPDGSVFAVDQDRFDAQEGRAADWIVNPLGGLLDVSALRAASDEPDISAPYRFTNVCEEIVLPGGDAVGTMPIDPERPAYMTSGCCEVASVTQEDLERLGLPFGQFDGAFYPLTDDEARYIAEDVVDSDDGLHGALTGYAVLYRGAKHLMPTIEIGNDAPGDGQEYGFPPREKVLADAIAYADRIRPKFEAMGGNVLIDTS